MLSIPAVDTLRRVWKQDYLPQEKGGTWIADQDRLEATRLFFSPYDLDASAAKKRSTYWIGYKVHFTETCDEDRPRLITHVVTDIGPIPDRDELPEIHAALQHQDLLPHHHLVDAGYVDAEALVASQTEYHVDLVGPTAQDHRWQAREQNGYALTDFFIDWEHEQARCPQGQVSSSWTPTRTRNQEVIKIKFGYATCGACPVRLFCTQSRQRTLTVRRHQAYVALEAARQRELTKAFAELYAQRAGIEGTHAQGVRRMGLRRSRYIGEPRTHLQHVAIATAINLSRLYDWLTGIAPHHTPQSHFALFMQKKRLSSALNAATEHSEKTTFPLFDQK
jgi:transposase